MSGYWVKAHSPHYSIDLWVNEALIKSDTPIPDGARWITVHPNGPASKGTPVLVQESPHHKGVFHVVGGAGGKLNFLRLHGLKSGEDARAAAKARQSARTEERRAQVAQDKASGVHAQKQAAKQVIREEKRKHEQQFIASVAEAMGWDGHLPADGLDQKELNQHHRTWLKRANNAVKVQKNALLADADARAQLLGHDGLGLADLELKPKLPKQLGMHVQWKKTANKHASPASPTSESTELPAATHPFAESLEQARATADADIEPPPQPRLADTQQLVSILKARQQMLAAQKAAKQANKTVDKSDKPPVGAFHLPVSDDGIDDVKTELLNDLRTLKTRSFLDQVGQRDDHAAISQHIAGGAHAALNSVALTVAGTGMIERPVTELLGVAGAAQVLARQLKSQLTAQELGVLQHSIADYHLDHYMKATESALHEARQWNDTAQSLDTDLLNAGDDVSLAQELLNRKAEAIGHAQRIYGRTLGEMEANAALVAALESHTATNELSLPINANDAQTAALRVRALGLKDGEFELHSEGDTHTLTIHAAGLDRLAKPIDRAMMRRYQTSKEILSGQRDEQGWLATGIARRPDLAMSHLESGVLPSLAEPFTRGRDMRQSIKDYAGGRMADGDSPIDIIADLHGLDSSTEYQQALSQLNPTSELLDQWADAFVKARHGDARTTLNKQRIDVNDPKVHDALHRALGQVGGEAVAAYKPIGELSASERGALKSAWVKAHPKQSWADHLAETGSIEAALQSAQAGLRGQFAEQYAELHNRILPDAPIKLGSDGQNKTLGHTAERQVAQLMQSIGANFRSGDKVAFWQPSMDGHYILTQRAIKFIEANKRVAAGLGVGTGKSLIGLGAFTHLHSQGKVKKGLFVVPSIVQGQFHGEALRYLEPGKYQWFAKPGASRAERIAAMRDPNNHFTVVTHQSLRDDVLHLGAEAAGISPKAMADQLAGMSVLERKTWAQQVLNDAGINVDFMMMDEAHGSLNRQGKDNSSLANVLDAVGHNAEYSVLASADPVKNDASEVFSLLQKLDPERYTDQDAFLLKYGNAPDQKEALRREMLPYLITGRTEPDTQVNKSEHSVALNDGQKELIQQLDNAAARAKLARIQGKVDVEAVKTLSPESFADQPEEQHEAIAKRLQSSVGIMHTSAVQKAIDDRGQSAKLDAVVSLAAKRKGQPGVIFAHSLDVAKEIHERLSNDGHRVALLTGAHSAQERAEIRQQFHPEQGEPSKDILVMSDAGAVGLNAQRGQWLMQYDTPTTAMVHAQRQGRIHRLGQKNKQIELIDLVADHKAERTARKRLKNKYALREVLTDPVAGLDDTGLAGFLMQRRMQQVGNE